ncbi:MAG: cytochrome c biogenesis protein CcdA [Nitrospinota bacterium]|nr:cytochrome c biogenesis protein CcdA [Nitrospinota bacterium]
MSADSMNVGLAFWAGFLSFLSPCVLPLFPSYLSFLTGLTYEEITDDKRRDSVRGLIFINSIFFVLGFSVFFISVGLSFSFIGQFFSASQDFLRLFGGVVIFTFGLYVLDRAFLFGFQIFFRGLKSLSKCLFSIAILIVSIFFFLSGFKLVIGLILSVLLYLLICLAPSFLGREGRIAVKNKTSGFAGSFLIGITFSAGWTPCIGPILGSILIFSSVQENYSRGLLLLISYCFGLGSTFLVSGVILSSFLKFYGYFKRYLIYIDFINSCLLMFIGFLLLFNYFTIISNYIVIWTGFGGI